MRANFSPREAIEVAFRYYDYLRGQGDSHADALEATVSHYRLNITPGQFDELLGLRERQSAPRRIPSAAELEEWMNA